MSITDLCVVCVRYLGLQSNCLEAVIHLAQNTIGDSQMTGGRKCEISSLERKGSESIEGLGR